MTHNNKTVAETLDNETWRTVNDCALWIHEQAELDRLQRGALEHIGKIVPHRVSMFDLIELDGRGTVSYTHPVSTTMDDATLTAYYRDFAALDYTTWSFDTREVNVYRDLDLVDVDRRDATPIYREWMEPQGIYYGCTATLAHNGDPLGTITLFRAREAGDFHPREMRALKEIARHASVALARIGRAVGAQAYAANSAHAVDAHTLAESRGLNPREAEVLDLMLAGHTNREMAAALFISESTVKKHVNAVYRKLGVRNRMELARLGR